MKKVIKSRIFLILICGIIFMNVGIYAATIYKASDILYKASDGTSMNVEDALNELYGIKTNNSSFVILLSSSDSGRTISKITKNYDVKTILTEKNSNIDYQTLTEENFIISITSYVRKEYTSSSKTKNSGGTITKSYNATTGILTITFPSMSAAFTSGSSYAVSPMDITFDVYLILNNN